MADDDNISKEDKLAERDDAELESKEEDDGGGKESASHPRVGQSFQTDQSGSKISSSESFSD
jgi:hypothetical protein